MGGVQSVTTANMCIGTSSSAHPAAPASAASDARTGELTPVPIDHRASSIHSERAGGPRYIDDDCQVYAA